MLVARSEDRLRELAGKLEKAHGVKATVIACDLGVPEGPDKLFAAVAAAGLTIDILVNNAGYGANGAFAEADVAKTMGIITLNIGALTHLTRLFLPGMLERKHGRVLTVASTAAFQPGPFMAVYCASKAYALSFSEALATELSGTGVTATALCPGPVATEFQLRSEATNALFKSGVMSAEQVAEEGYHATMKGRLNVVPGPRNWWLAASIRVMPRPMVLGFAKSLLAPGH